LVLLPRSLLFGSDKVYIAPSGVQKERILPSHIFVLPFPAPDGDRVFLRRPSLNLKESACTPLFWNAFDLRGAGSCIHTHSQHAVIVTLLTPGNLFRMSHQVGRSSDYVRLHVGSWGLTAASVHVIGGKILRRVALSEAQQTLNLT
jgi:ribulose-5-phosphate 4-epimerase/fuculose-1-phosphate aldolase